MKASARHDWVFLLVCSLSVIGPLVHYVLGVRVLDKVIDIAFVLWVAYRLLLRASHEDFRYIQIYGGLVLYVCLGFFVSFSNFEVGIFAYEAKLFVAVAVIIEVVAYRRPLQSVLIPSIRVFNFISVLAVVEFLVLFPGRRLNIINEGNYYCLLYGVIAFTLLEARRFEGVDRGVAFRRPKDISDFDVILTFVVSVLIVAVSASRTGAVYFLLCWLLFLGGHTRSRYLAYLLVGFPFVAILLIMSSDQFLLLNRLQQAQDVESLDRFVFLKAYFGFVEDSNPLKVLLSFNFVGFAERNLRGMDWWVNRWAENKDMAVGGVGLAALHFHSAFIRIAYGHGVIPLLIYLSSFVYFWRLNKYIGVTLLVGSFSMSVPYLSVVFPALYIGLRYRRANFISCSGKCKT